MKISIKSIAAVVLLQVGLANAQSIKPNLKTLSAGVRLTHMYDLPSYMFDSELGKDLKGLNGENTSIDLGYDIYLEKQFTPLLGVQLSFRKGGLTGANDVEYYSNSFYVGSADVIFNLANMDKWHPESRLNYYAKLGLGRGKFEAHRYLLSDDSPNGQKEKAYWEGHAGLGLQYELTSYLRVELDMTYNVAFDDGFDGYNYGTGNDSYLSTGLGLAYTFGKKDRKPMYGVNFFGEEYFGPVNSGANTNRSVKDQNPKADSAMVARLARELGDIKASLAAMQMVEEDKDATIARLQREQEELKLKVKALEALNSEGQVKIKKSTKVIDKPMQTSVFFEFDSDVLSVEGKMELSKALKGVDAQILLIGYTDTKGSKNYNEKLKIRRANSVRKYLVETLGIDPNKIDTKVANSLEVADDDSFNRRVTVDYSRKTTLEETSFNQ